LGESSHLKFLVAYGVFFLFMSQMTAWGAETIVSSDFVDVSAPTCEIEGWDAVIDAIGCIFSNLGVFLGMMTVSSEFAVIGTVLLIPLLIGMIYVILDLIRG